MTSQVYRRDVQVVRSRRERKEARQSAGRGLRNRWNLAISCKDARQRLAGSLPQLSCSGIWDTAESSARGQVQGISLSPKQVERATELAAAAKLSNVKFNVMDALKMDFPDGSFDLVWACESGEHMPDKRK